MRFSAILALIGVLTFSTFAGAGIVHYTFNPDGDGVFEMPLGPVVGNPACVQECDINIAGTLQEVINEPNVGHLLGTITTDNPDDPTIKTYNAITNDDSFSWTGMTVDVMIGAANFTVPPVLALLSPNVDTPDNQPTDWTAAITQSMTWNSTLNKYVGQIKYTGITPVAPGEELDFNYQLTFKGSSSYTFCQQMTPVPEPGTLALVAFGAIGLLVVRRRFA
jgi:hypothetical protein